MSSDGDSRVQELFLAALQQPDDRRDDWLVAECGHDADLLAEVRSLLNVRTPKNDLLEQGLNGSLLAAVGVPDASPGALHIRCPHCHQAIELIAEREFEEVTCTACGSSFSLLAAEDTKPQSPSHDEKIAHFNVIEKVGFGAFGSVYEARDTKLDRIVAIKIPRKGQLSLTESERFLREARIAAQLRHPHIVSVHEVGRWNDTIYIVSDFVQGITLSDWLTGHQPTPQEAVGLCLMIGEALAYAHEHGVIHRDLKPGNILLDRKHVPHLTDFGLAKRNAGEITMTLAGLPVGTPAYMSPEQASGDGHNADAGSDIYSLGVILFELLTGERPFRGNPQMLIHQVQTEEAPSPRKFDSSVSRDLETICLKCLEKSRDKRYATATQLVDDLQRSLDHRPILARPVGRLERTWRWCKRKPVIAALSAAVAATSVLTTVMAVIATLSMNETEAVNNKLESTNSELSTTLQDKEAALADRDTALSQLRTSVRNEARQRYASAFQFIDRAERHGDLEQLRYFLSRETQESGDTGPMRGFEWYYWQRRAHQELLTIWGPFSSEIEFNHDGTRLAISGGIYDSLNGEEKLNVDLIALSSPRCTTFATNENTLYTGYDNGALARWTFDNGISQQQMLAETGSGEPVHKVGVTDQSIIGLRIDGRVTGWDIETHEQVFDHKLPVSIDAYAPYRIYTLNTKPRFVCLQGRQLLIADGTGHLRLCDMIDNTVNEPFTPFEIGNPTAAALSPNGTQAAIASTAGSVGIVNLATLETTVPITAPAVDRGTIVRMQYSPDGNQIACGTDHGTLRIYDANDGRLQAEILAHLDRVEDLDYSRDSARLVSVSHDQTTKVWDVENSPSLRLHRDFTADEPVIVMEDRLLTGTSSDNGILEFYDENQNQKVLSIGPHSDRVVAVCGSRSGNYAATLTETGLITIWDPIRNRAIRTFDVEISTVTQITFDHQTGNLFVVLKDRNKQVWNLVSGHEANYREATRLGVNLNNYATTEDEHVRVRVSRNGAPTLYTDRGWTTLKGHDEPVTAVTISQDGGRVATATSARVKLWDVETGLELLTLDWPVRGITQLAFANSNHQLIARSASGVTRVWDIRSDARDRLKYLYLKSIKSWADKLLQQGKLKAAQEQYESVLRKINEPFSNPSVLNALERRIPQRLYQSLAMDCFQGIAACEKSANGRENRNALADRMRDWFSGDTELLQALTIRQTAERLQDLGAKVFIRCGGESHPRNLASIAGLARITSVTTVDFEKSDIPIEVFDLMLTLESVERLKFQDCRLPETGLETLSDMPQLKSLWFTLMPTIEDERITVIRQLTGLESLVLWGTSVTGSNIELLRECTELKSMQLGYSKFESRNIPQLLQLPALEDVSFWNLPLEDAALEHLRGCPWKKLALGRTQITDAGLLHLESMANLRELNLAQTRITNAGAETLSRFPSLRILNLSETDVNDQALSSLSRIPSLQQLDVKGCDLTEEAVSAFREQKPNCRILGDSSTSQ